MRDTPRTDALRKTYAGISNSNPSPLLDHHAAIERELGDANRELLVHNRSVMELCQERDQLRADNRELNREAMNLTIERDRLKAELVLHKDAFLESVNLRAEVEALKSERNDAIKSAAHYHDKCDQLRSEVERLKAENSTFLFELSIWRKADAVLDADPSSTDDPCYINIQRIISQRDQWRAVAERILNASERLQLPRIVWTDEEASAIAAYEKLKGTK